MTEAAANRPDLKQLDLLIRQGQSNFVREVLTELKRSQMPREDLVEFADLARRVHLPLLIVRWLRPIVRPQQPVFPPARTQELAIYSLGLSRLGVFQEAIEILKKLPTDNYPQVLFYLGLVYIEQWDYLSAQAPLQKYVERPDITNYQKTVGLLNLAACYVNERNWRYADSALSLLLIETQSEDRKLLRANTIELLAQTKLFQNEVEQASILLKQSEEILLEKNHQYSFFIKKWLTIAHVIRYPDDFQNLMNIRQEALDAKLWETVRECDLFRAIILKDETLFLRVYFSSHSKAYKKRIMKIFNWSQPVPLTYQNEILKCTGRLEIFHLKPESIEMPPLVYSLFVLLLSELYRPFSIPEIFSLLYPEEYFSHQISVKKVERLIQRLRQVLKKNAIPLEVRNDDGKLFLDAVARVIVNVNRKKKQVN